MKMASHLQRLGASFLFWMLLGATGPAWRQVDSSGLAAAVVELARDVSIGCGRGP